MIEFTGVVKYYDEFQALREMTMTVPRGSIYGLVGANGAGKSTAIRCLMGILRPESGSITVDGQPVYENPEVKAKFAYIPDEIAHFPQDNMRDLMKFYKGIYPSFDQDRWDRLGQVFQLDEKRPLRKFSRGMKKQAAFRLALSLRPEYLILDEPVDGLDPVMRKQVWSLVMADNAQHGTTVLVSSHNLRELEEICDHLGIMRQGQIIAEKKVDGEENLEELFMEEMGGLSYDAKDILL